MRFMMLVKSDEKPESGIGPDEKALSEMRKYNDEMTKAGVMLAAEGLQASSKGTRVRRQANKVSVVDGPFSEAKELVAGYWLIQTKSKEEAIEWAKRVPFQDGQVELRPLYELEDFPVSAEEKPEGWRADEQRFRDGAEAAGAAAPPTPRKPGTTRYMVFLKGSKATESGALPSEKTLGEMGALMGEVAQAGELLGGEGLKPSSHGTRVHFAGSRRTVVDGPFSETKELVAGFILIQVKSKEAATDLAKRWLQIHAEGLGLDEAEIEIRPI